jgi:metal-responsive CopG/Arc/MetJ family transcriptional regulator
METIQIVIDPELLRAADREVRRAKTNRSALIREALRAYLRRLRVRELEEQERRAYAAKPQRAGEWKDLAPYAVWPEE